MSHIHIRKQSDSDFIRALIVRSQGIVLISSIIMLGAIAVGMTAAVVHLERRCALEARV